MLDKYRYYSVQCNAGYFVHLEKYDTLCYFAIWLYSGNVPQVGAHRNVKESNFWVVTWMDEHLIKQWVDVWKTSYRVLEIYGMWDSTPDYIYDSLLLNLSSWLLIHETWCLSLHSLLLTLYLLLLSFDSLSFNSRLWAQVSWLSTVFFMALDS